MSRTLYDKLWDDHIIYSEEDGTATIYIDRQLLHEVTSPQAFEGLNMAGRPVWRISANLAVSDHNVPTTDRSEGISDPISKLQVDTLDQNCDAFGITQYKMNDARQGIVHVIGPEQGATLPGMTVVCGDSHTSTHGAFGALAFGIGTSEVEHVLATQTLLMKKSKNMLVRVDGRLQPGSTAKDIVLAVIGKIGTAGGTGYSLVSVRITGGSGTGAFGTAVVTAGVITSITITDKGSGFVSMPTLEVSLPRFRIRTDGYRTDFTGDVLTNTPEAIRGRDIREGLFLRGETSGALAQILAHSGALDSDGNEIFDVDIKFGNFVIDEVRCTVFTSPGRG